MKESQKKIKDLANEVMNFPLKMCAHNLIYSWFVLFLKKIFKAQQENLAAANKLKAERDPVNHSQQLEVIQLQQEFYAFYATLLPADFKKDNILYSIDSLLSSKVIQYRYIN